MRTGHPLALSAIAILVVAPSMPHAQSNPTQPQADPVGWEFLALPALNFNSDEGIGYGALFEAYNYGNGVRPYRFVIQPTVLLTTRGRRDVTVFFDAPELLPRGWRLDAFAGREQELAAPYYGIGNDAQHDTALSRDPNPYFYRYGRDRVRVLATLQRQLGGQASRLRALGGVGYARVSTDRTPFDSGTTLFAQHFADAPSGTLVFVRTGLVWDTRDHEIGARSGWWNELLVQHVNRALGASHTYTRVTAAARRYVPLSTRFTSATRIIAQQVGGEVPIYDLATVQSSYKQEEGLGGSKMLRGVPKNRVVGKGLVLANNELRWRAVDFGIRGKPAFLLLSGFVDVGRVWADAIRVDQLTSDLWTGYGGGARLGLGANSVIAFDIGRSSAATQLYIGLGYAY